MARAALLRRGIASHRSAIAERLPGAWGKPLRIPRSPCAEGLFLGCVT